MVAPAGITVRPDASVTASVMLVVKVSPALFRRVEISAVVVEVISAPAGAVRVAGAAGAAGGGAGRGAAGGGAGRVLGGGGAGWAAGG